MTSKNELSTDVEKFRINAFVRMRDALAVRTRKDHKVVRFLTPRLFKADDSMLKRHHPHLITPYQNTQIHRVRQMPQSVITFITLQSCFWLSYLYARLRHDE